LRALCALFLFAALCAATTKTPAGKGPPRTPQGKENAMHDLHQASARAELLLAADVGPKARGRPIHGRLESEDGDSEAGPSLTRAPATPRASTA